jgi:hypothetical protein
VSFWEAEPQRSVSIKSLPGKFRAQPFSSSLVRVDHLADRFYAYANQRILPERIVGSSVVFLVNVLQPSQAACIFSFRNCPYLPEWGELHVNASNRSIVTPGIHGL